MGPRAEAGADASASIPSHPSTSSAAGPAPSAPQGDPAAPPSVPPGLGPDTGQMALPAVPAASAGIDTKPHQAKPPAAMPEIGATIHAAQASAPALMDMGPPMPQPIPPTQATPARAAPPQPASSPAYAASDQVTPAVLRLLASPAGGSLTLHLAPATLGQVEIHVTRPADAPAHVTITVQRPETLVLLQRDPGGLGDALGRAGLDAGAHDVTLRLAPGDAAPAAAAAPRAETQPATASAGHQPPPPPAQVQAQAAIQPSAFAGHGTLPDHRGGRPSWSRQPSAAAGAEADAIDEPTISARQTAIWLRAGLDITA